MILVTGAAGHLGNVLCRELTKRGEQVRALVLPGERLTSLEGLPVERFEGNILNPEELSRATEGIDLVYHMAGLVDITPDRYEVMRRVNVDGTRNVIDACRENGVGRLVYTSSIHALERPPLGTIVDERLRFDVDNPSGMYDRTKAQASVLVLEAVKQGLDAVIVAPTGVIGPYDFNRSEMGRMLLSWTRKGLALTVEGAYDFVDVRDVALGHILAAEKGKRGEVYLLGGEKVTVVQIQEMAQAVVGIKNHRMYAPTWLARLIAPVAEFYTRLTHTRPILTKYAIETLQSNANISHQKAVNELGWKPRPLKESVKDTVEWFQENLRSTQAGLRTDSLQ